MPTHLLPWMVSTSLVEGKQWPLVALTCFFAGMFNTKAEVRSAVAGQLPGQSFDPSAAGMCACIHERKHATLEARGVVSRFNSMRMHMHGNGSSQPAIGKPIVVVQTTHVMHNHRWGSHSLWCHGVPICLRRPGNTQTQQPNKPPYFHIRPCRAQANNIKSEPALT